MASSTIVKAKRLNWMKGTAFGTAPTAVYLGFASSLTDNGSTENTATYFSSRVAITFATPSTVGGNRTIASDATVAMGTTIAAGSVSFFEVWDSASGGNVLWSGTITNSSGSASPITFGIGDSINISSGAISLFVVLSTNSVYSADILLNWIRGTAYPSAPANLYAAIANVSGTESTSLGRKIIPSTGWGSIAVTGINQKIQNANIVDWGTASVAFPSAARVTLWDAASAGNALGFGVFTQKDIASGDSVLLSAGALSITES